jgi:hypothetical protein
VILKVKWVTNTRLSLRCYHYLAVPLIREPPKIPLPDPEENPAWYGEFWIKYPLNQTLYPMYYGQVFKARSEFCAIVNRISLGLFDREGKEGKECEEGEEVGKAAQPSLKNVVGFIGDFTAWYVSLPEPLTAKRIVFPSQISLQ